MVTMNCLTFHEKNKDMVLTAFAVEQRSIISGYSHLFKLVEESCAVCHLLSDKTYSVQWNVYKNN